MKLVVAILILAVVFVAPSMATDLDTAAFERLTAVKLSDAEAVKIEMNDVLVAKVTNVATLTKLGLKGTKTGQRVQVPYLGEERWKLEIPGTNNECTAMVSWLQVPKKWSFILPRSSA